jgi:hypothetical protein
VAQRRSGVGITGPGPPVTLAVPLPVGSTTRRGDLGTSVPVFLSPTARHLPIHLLAIVSVRPTLHQRERMGWWGGCGRRSEREEGVGGFWE